MRTRLLASIMMIAGAISAAGAADLSVQAPVYKAPVAAPAGWSWTGFYLGGEAGGKWESDNWTGGHLEQW
jgi:outer membrane immunogenic protein